MKSFFLLFSASMAVLALAACSPSTPASSASASVSETAAATIAAEETVVTESEASSAATVVVTAAETYDPVVIRQMGEKPGYWELKHTDPKTKKSYVTHVCVDKPLGARMAKQGDITAPAGRGDYRTDASFKGECPGGVKGGDVQRSDGNKVNAYGDGKSGPPAVGNGSRPDDHKDGQNDDKTSSRGEDRSQGGSGGRPDSGQGKASSSPEPSHNPHVTPAEDHANDRSKSDASRPDQKH